jgi:hypothetical protein
MVNHGITGKWRGHYSYHRRPDDGSGFDVSFIEEKDGLTGTVRDDFAPHDATLLGTFSYPAVAFVKTYTQPTYFPIKYEGTMSDDGKSIRGTWVIEADPYSTSGTWTAFRASEDVPKQSDHSQRVRERQTEDVF